MNRFRAALALAALLSGLVAQAAPPGPVTVMTARLSGASEVPPVDSTATATVDARLDVQTRRLDWTIVYSGLSGPLTAGHFHGPAAAGANAGVALPLGPVLVSPITGSATLTDDQLRALRAGSWYVNLHTAAHPAGEIRGQVMVQP